MLDDPFLDQATELPTDLPFANDDEDSGCSGMAFKNLLYWFIFTKNIYWLIGKICCSRKSPHSGSPRRKSARCQSASSGLRNLNKSSRCRSSGSVKREVAPLEISAIDNQVVTESA